METLFKKTSFLITFFTFQNQCVFIVTSQVYPRQAPKVNNVKFREVFVPIISSMEIKTNL
jgi:hypothetical protein